MNKYKERPLILVTNDDGIESPGLHALADAAANLGDVLVVAPRHQQTASGRSMPRIDWEFTEWPLTLANGQTVVAYALDGSPAQAVRGGLMLIADRTPSLVLSGINYGENLGCGITVSGTVGAALEGASAGVPSLAVSLETEMDQYLSYSDAVDFSVAANFAQRVGAWMLDNHLPHHTDLLKLDVPIHATDDTEIRVTSLSRVVYFHSETEEQADGRRRFVSFARRVEADALDKASDVYAVMVDGVVSLTPLTIDMTAHGGLEPLKKAARTMDVQPSPLG